MPESIEVDAAVRRARQVAERAGRVLLGLAGAPAAGKSTLAAQIAEAVPGCVVVPMDGFHLPTEVLAERSLVAERGTPRTFDADGFVALLRALRAGHALRAPAFNRGHEEPVPAAIEVPDDAPLVVVEGNYLLVGEPPWDAVRELLDAVWFVEADEQGRLERLVSRHVSFGWSAAYSMQRAQFGSDADNARVVAATRGRADLVVHTDQRAVDLPR